MSAADRASTTMATSAARGSVGEVNGATAKPAASAQSPARPSFAARMSDQTRKTDEDGAQRRSAQPKAWTSGVNPITQRASGSSQVNGLGTRMGDKSSPDRQTWVYGNAVGLECNLVTKAGQSFSGVLVGSLRSNDDHKLVFKMVKDLSASSGAEEGAVTQESSNLRGQGPDHKMVFLSSSLQSFEVPQAPVAMKAYAPNGGFRTDADISGNLAQRERTLQRWDGGSSDKSLDLSLEPTGAGGWDQFKANEQQFGVKSDYDENIYTTQIDRKNPLYAMREREAERIAREIEGSATTNAHVREERGIVDDDGADEEEKYSGVRRDFASLQSNQPNRYIPPSRRNQAAPESSSVTTGSKEGPVDPAIISSQIARPTDPRPTESETPRTAQQTVPPVETALSPASPSTQPASALASTTAANDVKSPRQGAKPSGSGVTSNNIEQKVLDSFHQFSAIEKIKIQDQKRTRASADKAVRINDLMKFSKNFKLLTPVPKDLVPILAKDETKQKEIVQRAQHIAETSHSTKMATLVEPQKTSRPLASGRYDGDGSATATTSGERGRQASASQAGQAASATQPAQAAPATLSSKLSDYHRAHKAGTQANVPAALPIHEQRRESRGSAQQSGLSSPQKATSVRGPPSGTSAKFNVKAMEFKPTAPAFKPASSATTAVASSPRSGPTTRTISPATTPAKFFSEKTAFAKPEDRPTPASVAKQSRNESNSEHIGGESSAKASLPPIPASQGGFPFPYRTAPTWTVVDDPDNEPDYKAVFNERRPRRMNAPHPHASPGVGMPHHYPMPHGMPPGAQGMPPMQPHHTPQPMHQQPHYGHPPQFDDHQMRVSQSASSHYAAASPRMQQTNMFNQSPMPGHVQMAYPQHMQYQMQTPPMGGRQFSNGPPMGPMQGHLAPMMVPQHSGGFMPQQMGMPYSGQMPMYANPGPMPAMYGSPGQPNSGFPSPGRPAPMMMPQGSQQGQQPGFVPVNQYGQPMYAQQPGGPMVMRPVYGSPQPGYAQHQYPQHQYPQPVHRTPSQGYAQPHHTPQQQHAAPQQGPPQSAPSGEMGEEVK